MPTFPPKIGSTFRYEGYKHHVVAVLVDDGTTIVVVKYYGKRKQWWHYEVWDMFKFELIKTLSEK